MGIWTDSQVFHIQFSLCFKGVMLSFLARQKSPLQWLVLAIIFMKREGGNRLGHFKTEVKCVVGINGVFRHQFLKHCKRVGTLVVASIVHDMDDPLFRKNTKILVRDFFGKLFEKGKTMILQWRIA